MDSSAIAIKQEPLVLPPVPPMSLPRPLQLLLSLQETQESSQVPPPPPGSPPPQRVHIVFSVSKATLDAAEAREPRVRFRSQGKRAGWPKGQLAYGHYLRGAFSFGIYGIKGQDYHLAHCLQMPLIRGKNKKARTLNDKQMWNQTEEAWVVCLRIDTFVPGPYRVLISHPRIHSFWVDAV